uniref:Down syndrome cell adhesion molecule-like protein 1 homolog n=1 Tax=Cacopsylla melanoneura TaxID=428564 RepID=A0A8D9BNE3_9HEMI
MINNNLYTSTVPPKIAPFNFGEETLSEGQATSISCLVSMGDLPISFSWLLNGRRIEDASDILISQTGRRISQLSIDAVYHNHIGNYSCLASNNASTVSYTALLMVNG